MSSNTVINSACQLLDEEAQLTPTGPQAKKVSTLDQAHHHANPGGQSHHHEDQSHTQEHYQPTLTQPSNPGGENPDSRVIHRKTQQGLYLGGARPCEAAEPPAIGQQHQTTLGWQQPPSQEYFAHAQYSHMISDVDIWSRSINIAQVSMQKLKDKGFTKVEDLHLLSPPDL